MLILRIFKIRAFFFETFVTIIYKKNLTSSALDLLSDRCPIRRLNGSKLLVDTSQDYIADKTTVWQWVSHMFKQYNIETMKVTTSQAKQSWWEYYFVPLFQFFLSVSNDVNKVNNKCILNKLLNSYKLKLVGEALHLV